MPTYPNMDLGLQDYFNNLRGLGLDENDANMGTAMLAPLAYDRREQSLKNAKFAGFPGMQAPTPQTDKGIDLSFDYSAGFPGASKAAAFPEPAIQLNPTPMPPPKPAPAPQGGGEDLEIQPRKELGPQGPLTPLYTPDDQGIGFTSSGKPYQMATGDRKYQGPGNLGDAIAAAAWSARTGRPREEYFAEKGYNMAAGPMAPQNIVQRAAGGNDRQASDMLWQMVGKDPGAYARAVGGGELPFQIEDRMRNAAMDRAAADFELKKQQAQHAMGFQDRGLTEQGRQFDVNADLKRAQQTLDEAFRTKQIGVQQYQAETARNAAEANARNQGRALDLQATDPLRAKQNWINKQLQEAAGAAPEGQMSPVVAKELGLPTANQQESQALDLQLKQAQVDAAKAGITRGETGQLNPAQQRQAIQSAGLAAQQMVDQGMAPEEAGRRAAAQYGIKPELVPAAQYSMDPRAVRQNLTGLGFPDEQSAYKAALDAVVAQDPNLRSLFGNKLSGSEDRWLFQSSPMQDDAYRAAKQADIVRELIARGVPAPYAARIATQYTKPH